MSSQPLDPLSEILAEERFNQMRRLTLHSRMLRHAPEMFELLKDCFKTQYLDEEECERYKELIQKIEGEK